MSVLAVLFVFNFASVCWAQGLNLEITRANDTINFSITGATPSSSVTIGLEVVTCTGDLNGDHEVTDDDSVLLTDNFGPCHVWTSQVYDLNNDGFANSDDVAILEANIGCSAISGSLIPGCSIRADFDLAGATLLTVTTDSDGAGSTTLTMPSGYDATLYFQAIDAVACEKTPLDVLRFVHSDVTVAPVSSLSVVTYSDFITTFSPGLVKIDTPDGSEVFSKDSSGQIGGSVDVVPGDTAYVTLQQTACSFIAFDGSVVQGLALGAVHQVDIENSDTSTVYMENIFQTVADQVIVGNGNIMGTHFTAPFHANWELFGPDPTSQTYPSFISQTGIFMTPEEITRYLQYNAVDPMLIETADNAVYLNPDVTTYLGTGMNYGDGFVVRIPTDGLGYDPAIAPSVKVLSLVPDASDTRQPQVTVQAYDNKFLTLYISGWLPIGEHLILLSQQQFVMPSTVVVPSPPVIQDFAPMMMLAGIQDCDPPKPSPPSMSGTCEGGLSWYHYLLDCVITNNYTKSTTCYPAQTYRADIKCGSPNQDSTRKIKVEWKGSIKVSFSFKGVGAEAGEEVSYSEESSDTYKFQAGANGCGQCIAWWVHFKPCVTTFAIKYHRWEWKVILTGWCTECCTYVHSVCIADTAQSTTTCDRTCN